MRFDNGWQVHIRPDNSPKDMYDTDCSFVQVTACHVSRNMCYEENGLDAAHLTTLLFEFQRDDLETRKALTATPLEGHTLYDALTREGVDFKEAFARAFPHAPQK